MSSSQNSRSSRFGNIHSLIELNNKGGLFYYKVKNGDKMGNFDVTIKRYHFVGRTIRTPLSWMKCNLLIYILMR